MSDIEAIKTALEGVARRRRLERMFHGAWNGLAAGLLGWLVVLGVFKLAPLPAALVEWSWVVVAAGVASGVIWGATRVITLAGTARWVDSRRSLQERLSTAMELSEKETEGEWSGLVMADAARALPELNARTLLPLKLPRSSRFSLALVFCLAGLGMLPEYRTKAHIEQKKTEEIMKETGRALADLTRRSMAARPPAMEPTRRNLEEVQQLGNEIGKANLTKAEALKDLANVSEKLKDQMGDLARNPALKALEKAAKAPGKGGADATELQKKIDALSQALGDKAANPDALEKMKEQLQQAKEMAANLPDSKSPEFKDAKEKLEASLGDLAKQAQEMGLDLPTLSEAIAALKDLQADQVLKDLQYAEVELEKIQNMAKALEKMQMQAERLGKDLAEQLKNGQAEAAQSTLQKMMKELQGGKLDPEAMKKMMEEVQSAQKEGEEYGKVGELLKEAAKELKAGENSQAAAKLGQAAAELSKMMQEIGDAQSLIASLEALQAAQMSIANGMGWDQMQRAMGGRGAGNRRDGQPGRGVGTWTDENSWAYPDYADSWDNSGVERADTDGRGISDRGDGQLADNLSATKIKGQITPGGPMPSITLKGVSIKGTSKVEFREAAAAAQSEAQSALSQDQIPKAYQGAVRDYFDDFKE